MESTDKGLQIFTSYFSRGRSTLGSFVTFLYCSEGLEEKFCNVNFDESFYILTTRTEIFEFTDRYSTGKYLIKAFDIQDDGSLHFSYDNILWPAYSSEAILNRTNSTSEFL